MYSTRTASCSVGEICIVIVLRLCALCELCGSFLGDKEVRTDDANGLIGVFCSSASTAPNIDRSDIPLKHYLITEDYSLFLTPPVFFH